ncbi:LuxR C-terminal-related transcriptional regulator [Caulobacter segnis]
MSERLLSSRQSECLALVRQGFTSLEIAERLGISRRTVDQYIAEAGRRLGTRRRAQTVAEAAARGEI